MRQVLGVISLAIGISVFGAASARADTISFQQLTTNTTNIAGQLYVDVTDAGGGQVLFVVHNDGPGAVSSSITDIYWGWTGDGSLSSLFGSTVTIGTASAGVAFSDTATPSDPPGGNDIDWATYASADSNSPTVSNGIQVGEYARFLLTLAGTSTFSDVHTALGDSSLMMALHVQAVGGGTSDSYISTNIVINPNSTPTPEPATLALMAGSLGMGALVRRRRARVAAAGTNRS